MWCLSLIFFFQKKIAIQTQTSIPLKKTPPPSFQPYTDLFFFIARIPASIDGFWKNVCVPSSSIPARKQKESSVIEINYNLIWKQQQQKEKSSIFYFQIVVVEGTTPLHIGEKILFFFLFPLQFRFDAGFHSQQKKIIIKRQFFLPFSLVSPVCVCVCVTKQPKIPFRLVFIIQCQGLSHLSTEMSA